MSGIYIHIPFCKQACFYCDFHFSTSLKKKDKMVNAIKKELILRKTNYINTTVETIYFGGGTPSLLTQQQLDQVLETIYTHFSISKTPEITLEANPDDLTKKNIKALSKSPINRLSIGIQSFFDSDLKLMNRAHNAQEAKACLQHATEYFDNISLDLIYGIPNSSHKQWLENINTALGFNIPHISSYALTVEPRTALETLIKKGQIPETNEQLTHEQFHILIERLEANNYEHYELSNFAKTGYYSKNNSAYWQGKYYLGVGPSAHSFNGLQRSWNINNNTKYIKAIENDTLALETETLSKNDHYNEYVMTRLRTIWGISIKTIEAHFGASYKNHILLEAKKYINQQLLYIENEKIILTKKGKFLCDGIAAQLFKID